MGRTKRTALVVDSAACLPEELADRPYVHVVPMRLIFSDRDYVDGRDLTTTEFYRLLRESELPPTTSAPSPDSFLTAFHEAARGADSIMCLTVSSSFGGSYNAAQAAVVEARKDLPGVPVKLADSGSAAGGEALVATAAIRAIEEGGSLEGVAAEIEAVASKVLLYAFVDTLFYLWKGGRVPRIAHAGASLLQVKPLLEMSSGEIRTIGRPRTRRRATRRLIEATAARAAGDGAVHASVIHADAEDDAIELLAELRLQLNCVESFVSEFSPVMGAHTGPGLLGVASWVE